MKNGQLLPRRNASAWKPAVIVTLIFLGILVLLAVLSERNAARPRPDKLAADLTNEVQTVDRNLGRHPMRDPRGTFTIEQPAGWTTLTWPESSPYNVSFWSPSGVSIDIMTTRVGFNTLPELMEQIRQTEQVYGVALVPEPAHLMGRPVIKRTCRLNWAQVIAVDFVEDHVRHHLLCRVPVEVFGLYEPVLMKLLDTYRPIPRASGSSTNAEQQFSVSGS